MSNSAKVGLGILIGIVMTTEVFWFVRLERENKSLRRCIVALNNKIQDKKEVSSTPVRDIPIVDKQFVRPINKEPDTNMDDVISSLKAEIDMTPGNGDITKGYNNLMGFITNLSTPEDEELIANLKNK